MIKNLMINWKNNITNISDNEKRFDFVVTYLILLVFKYVVFGLIMFLIMYFKMLSGSNTKLNIALFLIIGHAIISTLLTFSLCIRRLNDVGFNDIKGRDLSVLIYMSLFIVVVLSYIFTNVYNIVLYVVYFIAIILFSLSSNLFGVKIAKNDDKPKLSPFIENRVKELQLKLENLEENSDEYIKTKEKIDKYLNK